MIDHQWFWDHVHSGEIWPKPRALGQKSAKDWCRHLLNVTEPEKYIVLALFVFFWMHFNTTSETAQNNPLGNTYVFYADFVVFSRYVKRISIFSFYIMCCFFISYCWMLKWVCLFICLLISLIYVYYTCYFKKIMIWRLTICSITVCIADKISTTLFINKTS